MKFVALVPTRNRPDLAQAAARALLAQQSPVEFAVVLSDNSSAGKHEPLEAFAHALGDARLHYVRPPAELDMARHWDWALAAALERTGATHLLVNTDRMLMRDGALAELATLAAQAPEAAISYNLDRIDDTAVPVKLERKRWSGAVAELSSRELFALAARCEFPECIPRLLNSLVPASAIADVRKRFGDACVSISPDFGYGFRHLVVRDTLRFFDKSLLVHYAISRSNGTSFLRGVDSPDLKDFKRFLGEAKFPATPYPEFFTVGNAMTHEYCAIRARVPELPPLDMTAYARCLYLDYTYAETPEQRALLLGLLKQRGLGADVERRERREAFKRRTKFIERAVRRVFRGPNYKPAELGFASLAEALAHDRAHPAPRQDSTAHLGRLSPLSIRAA